MLPFLDIIVAIGRFIRQQIVLTKLQVPEFLLILQLMGGHITRILLEIVCVPDNVHFVSVSLNPFCLWELL